MPLSVADPVLLHAADHDREAISWLGILAKSTLGARSLMVETEVRLCDFPRRLRQAGPLRLVVQLYPHRHDRVRLVNKPVCSAQRTVTFDELRRGISLHLVVVRDTASCCCAELLTAVAWIEPGFPDLELDALNARPGPNSLATTKLASLEVLSTKLCLSLQRKLDG